MKMEFRKCAGRLAAAMAAGALIFGAAPAFSADGGMNDPEIIGYADLTALGENAGIGASRAMASQMGLELGEGQEIPAGDVGLWMLDGKIGALFVFEEGKAKEYFDALAAEIDEDDPTARLTTVEENLPAIIGNTGGPAGETIEFAIVLLDADTVLAGTFEGDTVSLADLTPPDSYQEKLIATEADNPLLLVAGSFNHPSLLTNESTEKLESFYLEVNAVEDDFAAVARFTFADAADADGFMNQFGGFLGNSDIASIIELKRDGRTFELNIKEGSKALAALAVFSLMMDNPELQIRVRGEAGGAETAD